MMNIKKTLLFFLVLLAPVNAEERFTVRGELLNFLPSFDQPYYVGDGAFVVSPFLSTSVNAERVKNDPEFDLGLRLIGDCYIDLHGASTVLQGRVSYFNSHFSDTTEAVRLAPIVGFPLASPFLLYRGSAVAETGLKYSAGDLTYGLELSPHPSLHFTVFGGAHYANIECRESFSYIILDSIDGLLTKTKSEFWGIGPEFGFDFTCPILSRPHKHWNLAIVGDLRGALLAAQVSSRFKSSTRFDVISETVFFKNEKLWRVIPSVDLSAGISWAWQSACFTTGIELGYEFLWYQNSIDRITFSDDTLAFGSFDLYSDLSFQGPYLAISIGF